jgi:hypothetical protein
VRRIRACDRRRCAQQPLGSRRLHVFVGDQAVFMLNAERVEETAHHRPLLRQVIHHQQSRREQLGHRAERHQMPRLLLDRQRDDALRAEFDLLGDQRHRLGLLERRIVVAPERLRRLQLALRRERFP